MKHEPIDADAGAPLVAGVELGGTKCVAMLASGPGRILARETVPTTVPDVCLPALRSILDGWQRTHVLAALGIASFGPLRLDPVAADFGHILATNKPGWVGADVTGTLGGGFDGPVAIDTDVNGAALAERCWGAARGLDDFAYVTVGTGVGVGLIVHGRPTRGIGHSEMGHLRVPRLAGDTLPTGCRFHDDCVEGLASGSGIAAALNGRPIEALAPDDPLWDRVVAAVAALCHAIACSTGPHRIAIGGGVFEKQPGLLARVEPALRHSINGYLALPPAPYIVAPELGGLAGPLGPIAMARSLLSEDVQ